MPAREGPAPSDLGEAPPKLIATLGYRVPPKGPPSLSVTSARFHLQTRSPSEVRAWDFNWEIWG